MLIKQKSVTGLGGALDKLPVQDQKIVGGGKFFLPLTGQG